MELNYKIQNYDWGKRGSHSQVAVLYSNVNKDFKINETTPYSELWIGTHINGPSTLKATGELLADVIIKHPHYLGDSVLKKFGQQLPFLFKILSVNQALSIQAHPSKKHAEELHAQRPDIYKDPNHKPELAIALTPFEALCGFRPLPEIYSFLQKIPELKNVVGSAIMTKYNNGKTDSIDLLKDAFRAVLTASQETITSQLNELVERLRTLDTKSRDDNLAELVEKLSLQYPNDRGCFVVYFLNYLKLQPFEALYLGANEPHAYLYGDCVECMACSDNVVRAGLTPKYIDVDTLCSMLIYKGEEPKEKIFKPLIEDAHCQLFKPSVPDFAVAQINIPAGTRSYETSPRTSASTLLVVAGKAKSSQGDLIPGTAVFLPANKTFEITDVSEKLLVYQGLANL